MFSRTLEIQLPATQSAFLWGARKTGKSTLLRQKFPAGLYYDLLDFKVYDRFHKDPSLLGQEIAALPQPPSRVIIDEVQKVPELLDEVHRLIVAQKISFILCGSSARKLKRGQANLLGGRAWRYHLLPLCWQEMGGYNLLQAIQRGLIPDHYLSHQADMDLRGYVQDYLKEEIQAEALTRNLRAFSLFLDAAAFSNAQALNYTTIARDIGIDAKTVKAYFGILEDTMIGYHIFPYRLRQSRSDLVETPKFYFFDVGVAQFLAKRHIAELRGPEAGHAFEHLVLMELKAWLTYQHPGEEIFYWRTRSGLEVDFVLLQASLAIEVKISTNLKPTDLHGLKAFLNDNPKAKAFVVVPDAIKRLLTVDDHKICVVSFAEFMTELWANKYFCNLA